jgi:hypothetical protein
MWCNITQAKLAAMMAQILFTVKFHKVKCLLLASFCSYVEHRAFVKPFHSVVSKASPFASFQLIPTFCSSLSTFFSSFFSIYPSSWCPEGSSPMRVFLLHVVVYVMYGKSNAIFFPLFVVRWVFVFVLCHNSSLGIFSSHSTFKIRRRHQFTNVKCAHKLF